jgi:hypothetical protein
MFIINVLSYMVIINDNINVDLLDSYMLVLMSEGYDDLCGRS